MSEDRYVNTLFDQYDSEGKKIISDTLKVVKAQFIESEETNWIDLFEGFSELYAITYSSSIGFTADLLKYFETAEIIYGCYNVLNPKAAAIISAQQVVIEAICESKAINYLVDRMNGNSLHLFLSRDTNSHEKIYILKGEDGATRVITGSANMSYNAFNGIQRENITYFDDQEAFDYYYKLYERYKETCSDSIPSDLITKVKNNKHYLKEHIEELPILEYVEKNHQIEIYSTEEETDIVADVRGREDEIKSVLPKRLNKGNTIKVTSEDLKIIKKENKSSFEKRKRDHVLPKLHLDFDQRKVMFNGKQFNLHPSEQDIKKDVECLIEFINGYNDFDGNVEAAQKDYYAYMNWFFASSFIPMLRDIAIPHGYSQNYFPVFGLLCGQSNAGKTKFISLLAKLMTGEKIKASGNDIFSLREMDKIKRTCEGVPILIEDLAKAQYDNNYEKVIKDEEFGLAEHLINYPAVSITANKINSLTPDITKRVVYFRIDISTDKKTGAKNSKQVNDSIDHCNTSLYSEYVRRMFPRVEEMAEKMIENDKDYSPDILQLSASVLKEIISEYRSILPFYIRDLDFDSYFGDEVIGRTAIEKIKKAWRNQSGNFKIDKRENTITYEAPENVSYEIKALANELPSKLNAKSFSGMLVMDLDAAKEFFGISFNRNIFSRIFK